MDAISPSGVMSSSSLWLSLIHIFLAQGFFVDSPHRPQETAQGDIRVNDKLLFVGGLSPEVNPVSYTHLDVYKRQASLSASTAAWIMGMVFCWEMINDRIISQASCRRMRIPCPARAASVRYRSCLLYTSYRNSAEAMLRRIAQGKGLYYINNAIEINNLFSVKTGYSLGTYDLDRIEGDVELRRSPEGEHYRGIGKEAVNIGCLPVLYLSLIHIFRESCREDRQGRRRSIRGSYEQHHACSRG